MHAELRVFNTWDSDAVPRQELDVVIRLEGAGSLKVAVRSNRGLPDACFTFHPGDPQYENWFARYESQQSGSSEGPGS